MIKSYENMHCGFDKYLERGKKTCTVAGAAQGMAIVEFPQKIGWGQSITALSGAAFGDTEPGTASCCMVTLL